MPEYTEKCWTDHQFTAWLREHGAIDNYKVGPNNVNYWYQGTGQDSVHVAFVIYNNAESTRKIYIRKDLLEN